MDVTCRRSGRSPDSVSGFLTRDLRRRGGGLRGATFFNRTAPSGASSLECSFCVDESVKYATCESLFGKFAFEQQGIHFTGRLQDQFEMLRALIPIPRGPDTPATPGLRRCRLCNSGPIACAAMRRTMRCRFTADWYRGTIVRATIATTGANAHRSRRDIRSAASPVHVRSESAGAKGVQVD